MDTGPTVLVVDDDQDTRDLYRIFLKTQGFAVETARNGMEGLTRAAESRPAVIVTDLAMPGSGGWDLVKRFQTDPRTKGIPVVVLTGWVAASDEKNALRSRCAAFLKKPCEPAALASELRHLVAGQPELPPAVSGGGAPEGEPTCRLKRDRRQRAH